MATATPHIKDLISRRMKALGYSDGHVASELSALGIECSRVSILRYRTGQRIPAMEHGVALSRVLQIPPAALMQAAERQYRATKAEAA